MSQKRSNLIDIIKGLMMVFIIITHFNFIYPDDYKKYGFFFYIDMAVPVFMIITGYLHAIQFSKKDIRSFSQAMSPTIIIPKILRFFVPYFLIMLVEIPILYKVYDYGILDLFNTVICGGIGPGSYYTPAMIQIVFILPMVYFIIKRYDFFGTILCFIFTAFWELLQYSWGMSDSVYRLVAFRYVSVIAWGTFIAIGKVQLKRTILIIMFIIGIIFQISLNYFSFNPVFMNYGWARVNYIASLFIMPIIYFILKNFNNCNINFL